jgi:cytochrome c oxidase subunit I
MSAIPLVPEPTQALPSLRSNEGLLSWVASVDHKQIGIMYIVVTIFFLMVGGVEAMLMRIQLMQARMNFLSPEAYNQIFTMHGTTMIFLVVMPLLIGFANYLVPLMIGARDVAFPRLNALSFWLLLFSGLLLYYSFIAGGAPDAGWFAYAPLSEKPYSTTPGMDYYALGLLASGIGTVAAAINLIVTILKLRAPGMTLRRLPLFVWMTLFNSVLIILALPALNASLVMLLIDRQLFAHFFDPLHGGHPLLWQHIFWSFGHPEVYIMVLPAFGMISEVLPVFSRKPIYGYGFVAGSTVAIMVLSLLVYGHHMFAAGMGFTLNLAFGLTSMLIAIPTGVKIFNWLATVWGGALRFTTSMCFGLAFLILFTIGGVTGVMFAIVPVDKQLTDTYFVVAHMHYVLFGGTLFAVFSGFYYWFPKVTGRLLSERIGAFHFWSAFIGFNMTFFIQHVLGWDGMARRIFTYPDMPGWSLMNFISTMGAFVLAISMIIFVWNIIYSLRRGAIAGDNPWNAWTLEWATTSPPPIYNFEQVPPVRSRRPLWDLAHPDEADYKHAEGGGGSQS